MERIQKVVELTLNLGDCAVTLKIKIPYRKEDLYKGNLIALRG